MCKPDFYTVSYRINPWMHPEEPTDTSKAVAQWQSLVDVYEQLGFDISYIDPIDGLPDMVYAANGGFVLDGIAYGAKFQYPERQPEGPAYMDWFRQAGLTVAEPVQTNEGEGDFLLIGNTIYAGTGFRSDSTSHEELAEVYGREVVTLKLINPSFYHLDTAIAVLDPEPSADGTSNIAYLESAFDEPSLAILRERFPDAIIATEEDAAILGLNSYSDGYNIVIAARATSSPSSCARRATTRSASTCPSCCSAAAASSAARSTCTRSAPAPPSRVPRGQLMAAAAALGQHRGGARRRGPRPRAQLQPAARRHRLRRRRDRHRRRRQQYLDGLAAYSAVNFGHGNPRLLDAARAQLDRVTLTSRAFVNDQLGPFATALAALHGRPTWSCR